MIFWEEFQPTETRCIGIPLDHPSCKGIAPWNLDRFTTIWCLQRKANNKWATYFPPNGKIHPKKEANSPKKIWTHNKFSQQLSTSHLNWHEASTLRQVHRGILTLHSRCPHVTPMTGHVCAKEVPNNWLLMQLEGLMNSILLWNLPFDVSVYTMMLNKNPFSSHLTYVKYLFRMDTFVFHRNVTIGGRALLIITA